MRAMPWSARSELGGLIMNSPIKAAVSSYLLVGGKVNGSSYWGGLSAHISTQQALNKHSGWYRVCMILFGENGMSADHWRKK